MHISLDCIVLSTTFARNLKLKPYSINMKHFQLSSKYFVIAAIFLLSGLSFAFKANSNSDQISICHVPPGNTNNCQEITISISALQAHLDHGDDLICNSAEELEVYNHVLMMHLAEHPNAHNTLIRRY